MSPPSLSAAASDEEQAGKAARSFPAALRPGLAVLLYLLVAWVLPPPLPIRLESNLLDPSWQIVLTDGFLHGAQFGRDIIYTYGPWGFLSTPRGDPRIYPWLLGGRLLIALAFVAGISIIAARIRRLALRFVAVFWIALLADLPALLPLLLLLLTLGPEPPGDSGSESRLVNIQAAAVHLLAVACGLAMWIKFTSFVITGALIAALAVQELWKHRAPWISLEVVSSSFVFWLLARQSPLDLPDFLRGAFSTAFSYSAEMFTPGPDWEVAVVVLLLAAVAVPCAMIFRSRRSWRLWPSAGWVALLLFLQAKEALVRHDGAHIWMGAIRQLLPSALLLLCRAGLFDPVVPAVVPPEVRATARVCTALVVFLSLWLPAVELATRDGREQVATFADNFSAVIRRFTGEGFAAAYRSQLEAFRRKAPLTRVSGTADFFPDNQVLLYGNGLEPRLPPVPQAFAAYNADLTAVNAAFFRSASRPDFVFFDIAPIDNRYPSSSDPLSWRALMECYEPDGASGRWLLLRATGCVNSGSELVKETKVIPGEAVSVPADAGSAVRVQMEIRLNRAGSIAAALWKPPLTRLAVTTDAGRQIFRISPAAARTGFLLSPLIRDPASFGRLAQGEDIDPAARVRQFTISQSEPGRRLFDSPIRVRLYKVRLNKVLRRGRPALPVAGGRGGG